MNKEQRTVAVGAVSGIVSMIILVTVLYFLLPHVIGDPLKYLFGSFVLSIIPLFIMIITVANERFLSKAINPLRHAENTVMEINGRVVDNTLQQNFVFIVAVAALAAHLPIPHLHLVLALAITFVIARLAFWFGYLKNPLLRAPGMAATSYMNLFIILTVAYLTLF